MSQVSFPVYRLPSKPSESKGVLFYASEPRGGGELRITVVDDKNAQGKTLAARRLRLLAEGIKLYNFKLSVYFLADLLRLNAAGCYWIDSNGKLFKYTKTTGYKVVNRRITKMYEHNGYWLFEVEGLPDRFKSMYGPPGPSFNRALLLQDKLTSIFYGFTDSEDTKIKRRKI